MHGETVAKTAPYSFNWWSFGPSFPIHITVGCLTLTRVKLRSSQFRNSDYESSEEVGPRYWKKKLQLKNIIWKLDMCRMNPAGGQFVNVKLWSHLPSSQEETFMLGDKIKCNCRYTY